MRFLSFLILVLFSFAASAQEDYKLHINHTVLDLSLDSTYSVTIDGKPYRISIQMKDTLTYRDALFSFKYPKDLKVSRAEVDQSVDQVLLLNSSGTGFLIQAYRTLNPESLKEMLIEEATKENVTYGYTTERTEYERTLSSGQTLKVSRLVQKYKDNVRTYEVAMYGRKDEGLAIMAFDHISGALAPKVDLITLVWQTLRIY